MPQDEADRFKTLQIIGIALVAMEKVAALIYERTQRPEEVQHAPWIKRLDQQLRAAVDQLEAIVGDGSSWLTGADIMQADISAAIAWRFVQHAVPRRISADEYPGLVAFSARAEALSQFVACPLS
jgi:glutathione S-transferase